MRTRDGTLAGLLLAAGIFVGSVVGCGGSVDSSAFGEADTGSAGGDSSTTDGGGDATADTGGRADTDFVPEVPPDDTGGPVDDTAIALDSGTPIDTGVVDTGVPDTSTPCSALGKPYNGHCYFPLKVRSFAESQAVCKSYGGYLTAITSDGEQSFVQGLYPSADAWIGLQRTDVGKFDKWIDGESVTFNYWAFGEPNGSGLCVRMLGGGGGGGGRWADNPCTYTYNAICERDYL